MGGWGECEMGVLGGRKTVVRGQAQIAPPRKKYRFKSDLGENKIAPRAALGEAKIGSRGARGGQNWFKGYPLEVPKTKGPKQCVTPGNPNANWSKIGSQIARFCDMLGLQPIFIRTVLAMIF